VEGNPIALNPWVCLVGLEGYILLMVKVLFLSPITGVRLSFMAKFWTLDLGSLLLMLWYMVFCWLALGSYVSVPSCGCHFGMYALRLSTLYIRLLINTRRKVHRFTFSYQNMFVVS